MPSVLRIFYFQIFFLLPSFFYAQQQTGLENFLATKAVKVDSSEMREHINQFLNHQVEKGKVVWYKGSIKAKNAEYADLKLNFNVLNNSLYLLRENQIYRISNFELESFQIVQDQQLLKFKKGFAAEAFRANIKATFEGSSQDLLEYLNTYSEYQNLKIKSLEIVENNDTEMIVHLRTGFRNEVFGLKKFLGASDKISDLVIEYKPTDLGPSKYFQVLFEHPNFSVLKYHFKRSATSESVSLVKHEASFMFSDEDYFIADSSNRIQEFLFTKRSIERVLASLDIAFEKKVKRVGNESKVVKWFQNNTFY